MLQVAVAYYERCFDQLNCAKHPILGEAPHKPVLLLALIQMVETGTLKSKQIGLRSAAAALLVRDAGGGGGDVLRRRNREATDPQVP